MNYQKTENKIPGATMITLNFYDTLIKRTFRSAKQQSLAVSTVTKKTRKML